MKLALFLGSGISFETGLPRIEIITNAILYKEWHNYTDSIFQSGPPPDAASRLRNSAPWIQEFVRVVKAYSDCYLLPMSGKSTTYEDLFFLIKQLYDEGIETENAAIAEFYRFMQHETAMIAVRKPTDRFQLNVRELARRSLDFVQNVVIEQLWFDGKPVGYDLIVELARGVKTEEFDELFIFTLNHDLLIEKALSMNNINYTDGFGHPDQKGRRTYKRDIYRENVPVKLIKLHGSINWYRKRLTSKNIGYYDSYFCKKLDVPINFGIDDPLGLIPIFLTGTDNKMLSYTYGIIADMFYIFLDSLRNIDHMIISGYGWNDRGINARLREWLNSARTKRLILLHEEPERIRDESKMGRHNYDSWLRAKKLIIIRKFPKDIHCSDLKAKLH